LSEAQAQQRVTICKQLLENPHDDRFWKQIITGDEKWVFFRNTDRRTQWVPHGQEVQPVAKQDRFGKKVMLSVWWNFEGVLHFELVPHGRAVNAELYTQQLDCVYEVLKSRYPALVNRRCALLQHDNAPAHRARLTKAKIQELEGVELLPHPAYSPDVAPSDYGLFRSMATFLRGRRFETVSEVEEACHEFFASKDKDWYLHQIRLLAERWLTVIENDGLYFEE
jgi:histone-lysine N-methyltransferase SETMAR